MDYIVAGSDGRRLFSSGSSDVRVYPVFRAIKFKFEKLLFCQSAERRMAGTAFLRQREGAAEFSGKSRVQ